MRIEAIAKRSVLFATDRRHSDDLAANLWGYIQEGDWRERDLAFESLGYLGLESTLPELLTLLLQCESSLKAKAPLVGLPGAEEYALSVACSICAALAMFDSREAHRELAKRCDGPGNFYLRAEAIRLTALQCDYFDEELIRRYLSHPRSRYRMAALNGIYLLSGSRLRRFRQDVYSMLKDPSPQVVLSAVEVMTLLPRGEEWTAALEPLLDDHRHSRIHHSSVSSYASIYSDE
jgi:HEAT repeat protein